MRIIEKKKKQLTKGRNKIFCGVCSGLAEYCNMDISLMRILWALFGIFMSCGYGILFYIICAIIMPNKDDIY